MYFSFNGINALTHSAIEPQVQPESDIKFYWKKTFFVLFAAFDIIPVFSDLIWRQRRRRRRRCRRRRRRRFFTFFASLEELLIQSGLRQFQEEEREFF